MLLPFFWLIIRPVPRNYSSIPSVFFILYTMLKEEKKEKRKIEVVKNFQCRNCYYMNLTQRVLHAGKRCFGTSNDQQNINKGILLVTRFGNFAIIGIVWTRHHFCVVTRTTLSNLPLFANIVPINAATCHWPTDHADAVVIHNPLLESKSVKRLTLIHIPQIWTFSHLTT